LENKLLHVLGGLRIQLSESAELLGMVCRHGDDRRHHAQLSDRGVHFGRHRWADVLGSLEQIGLVGELPQDQRVFGDQQQRTQEACGIFAHAGSQSQRRNGRGLSAAGLRWDR